MPFKGCKTNKTIAISNILRNLFKKLHFLLENVTCVKSKEDPNVNDHRCIIIVIDIHLWIVFVHESDKIIFFQVGQKRYHD